MDPTASPDTDPTASLVPSVQFLAPGRVTSVVALADARLHLTFIDGTDGEADLDVFLRGSKVKGTVFEALRDPSHFARAEVVAETVHWPSGAELAPDAMYDTIRAHGRWQPD